MLAKELLLVIFVKRVDGATHPLRDLYSDGTRSRTTTTGATCQRVCQVSSLAWVIILRSRCSLGVRMDRRRLSTARPCVPKGASGTRKSVRQPSCPTPRWIPKRTGLILIATERSAYPHTDAGTAVRQLFHRLRSTAIEPFNNLFKNLFAWGGQVPVKGLRRTQLIVLGAIFVYQLLLLYQLQHNLPLGRNLKPLLKAA